jgi:bacterioferritin-associated ferredoxin
MNAQLEDPDELVYVDVRGRKYPVCSGCHKPIMRNLARFQHQAWHYGELRMTDAFGKAVAFCRKCLRYVAEKNLVRIGYDAVLGVEVRKCGSCGSEDLQFLQDRRAKQ